MVQRYGEAVRPTRTHAKKKEPPLKKEPLAVMPNQQGLTGSNFYFSKFFEVMILSRTRSFDRLAPSAPAICGSFFVVPFFTPDPVRPTRTPALNYESISAALSGHRRFWILLVIFT